MVTRPVLRYHGGKWRIAEWIIQNMPPHETYVEPFCGSASVLMQKPRSHNEVINDLNGRVVNVFRVLRDPESATRLRELLSLTPFSLAEYLQSREPADDPVEDARRMIVLAFQGHGSTGASGGKKTGWSRRLTAGRRSIAYSWADIPDHVSAWTERLRGVFIDQMDAFDLILKWDGPNTLFYVDPPYLASTRVTGRAYAYEMTEEQHVELAQLLHSIQGSAMVSGYPSPLYDSLYDGWHKLESNAMTDCANLTTEVLWVSPNAHVDLLSSVPMAKR